MKADIIKPEATEYKSLLTIISYTYVKGRTTALKTVNVQLLQTYWQIGKYIVEFEQKGATKAEYGKALLENLSRDLSIQHGKGFSRSNVKRMRQSFVHYPISAALSQQLTWSHVVELLKIENNLGRSFYEKQTLCTKIPTILT